MVAVIKAEVVHHGDWSELTKAHNVEIRNPHFAVSPKDDINIEYLVIRAERKEEIKNFINDIKFHSKVIKLLNYDIYKNTGYIIFIGKYSDSIKGIFMENMAIFKSAKFLDGVEFFTFLMPFYNKDIVDKIKEKLNNISTLLKFDIIKLQDNIIDLSLLTKRNVKSCLRLIDGAISITLGLLD
jgi:predicted DNA binding protein